MKRTGMSVFYVCIGGMCMYTCANLYFMCMGERVSVCVCVCVHTCAWERTHLVTQVYKHSGFKSHGIW